MKVIFEDTFNYFGYPDPEKWDYDYGGHGWGNNELQLYTDSKINAFVSDGTLKIIARNTRHGLVKYTSARLTTYGKFSFTYGRIDISAKLPKGMGCWPAIWMLPNSIREGIEWPRCGEIDIMEAIGKDPDMIHVSLHSDVHNHIKGTQRTHFERLLGANDGFHLYSVDWKADMINFLFDDRVVKTFVKTSHYMTNWPFSTPFYLLMNIAVGGNWPGFEIDESSMPWVMEVDFVRVSK